MENQRRVFSQEFVVELLGTLVMRIARVFERDNEAGVKENGALSHV